MVHQTGGLNKKHISLTGQQIKFAITKGSGNLSRYIRTLIDREMGREEYRIIGAVKNE